MYKQRVPTSGSDRRPSDQSWVPEGLPPGFEIIDGDSYVVVDDLMDGVAVLAPSPWPVLDRAGRLSFPEGSADSPSTFHLDVDVLQTRLNERRASAAEELGMDPALIDRPLRIGDAFLIRNLGDGKPGAWETVIDVTPQARTAAKTALYGAVAPRVSEQEAAELNLLPETGEAEAEEPPPGPPGGSPPGAAPAV